MSNNIYVFDLLYLLSFFLAWCDYIFQGADEKILSILTSSASERDFSFCSAVV